MSNWCTSSMHRDLSQLITKNSWKSWTPEVSCISGRNCETGKWGRENGEQVNRSKRRPRKNVLWWFNSGSKKYTDFQTVKFLSPFLELFSKYSTKMVLKILLLKTHTKVLRKINAL